MAVNGCGGSGGGCADSIDAVDNQIVIEAIIFLSKHIWILMLVIGTTDIDQQASNEDRPKAAVQAHRA